ncbi:DUF2218 domain-containing protein [Phaeobacter inhibens]|uniref:DUF2218 domain-containing protein n=1 Tax=Phaeobacter inhibens TaxID=221822 RepID=UPI00076BB227|nr:DUF2218 domain-containing protein [Phaeobacter inhibens]KXF92836.1 2,4-dihydroxyhept-2-ene-1,7-dioic acid aldolase [Phaeobacter inhibens]WHP70767.1 DUF2218 domain-containing protein [Phaeobacter inhibens]
MLTDTGHFNTPNASKYLQQLCKHFAHKVAVTHDDSRGTVALGMGPATLTASADRLLAEVTAPDAAELDHARLIIDNHLKRFAFREEFEAMTWASATAPA